MRMATPSPKRRASPRQRRRAWRSPNSRCAVRAPRRIDGAVHHVVVDEGEGLQQLEGGAGVDDHSASSASPPAPDEAPVAERRAQPLAAVHARGARSDSSGGSQVRAQLGPAGCLRVEQRVEAGLDPVGHRERGSAARRQWTGHVRTDGRATAAEDQPSSGVVERGGSSSATIWVTSTRAAVMRSRQTRSSSAARRHPGGEHVDVDGVVLDLVEDRLQLGQRLGVADLGGSVASGSAIAVHRRAAPRPAPSWVTRASSPARTSSGERTTRPSAVRVIDQPRASARSGRGPGRAPRPRPGSGRPRPWPAGAGAASRRSAVASVDDASRTCTRADPVSRPTSRPRRCSATTSATAPARRARRPCPSSRSPAPRATCARSGSARAAWARIRRSWAASSRCATRAIPLQRGLHSADERGRPARRAAGPHAVGVLATVWATSSATERSISWPMPVSTGTGASGDGAGHALVVEAGQVGAGAAAPHQRDDVDIARAAALAMPDAMCARRARALHPDVDAR